jgi:hypothetical protein
MRERQRRFDQLELEAERPEERRRDGCGLDC